MKERDEEYIRKYLDGELDSEQEREVLHIIAESEHLRELLRFERSLTLLQQQSSVRIPEGFADTVMQAVAARQAALTPASVRQEKQVTQKPHSRDSAEEKILERLSRVLDKMMTPAHFSLRPAWALLLLIVTGTWFLISGPEDSTLAQYRTESEQPSTHSSLQEGPMATTVVAEEEHEVWIRFVYIDQDADHIAVAGDFTGWNPMDLSSEWIGDKRVWTGVVRVSRGEHHYMFLRNGEEWITDPFADIHRDDGFGNENAVLYL